MRPSGPGRPGQRIDWQSVRRKEVSIYEERNCRVSLLRLSQGTPFRATPLDRSLLASSILAIF